MTKKRRVRIGLWVGAAVGLAAAAAAAWFQRESWAVRLPDAVLIRFADVRGGFVRTELRRRLEAGDLAPKHVPDVLALFAHEILVDLRSPFAGNTEQIFAVSCPANLSHKKWRVHLEELALVLDGNAVENATAMHDVEWRRDAGTENLLRLPPLDEGEYELTVKAAIVVEAVDEENEAAPSEAMRRPVEARKTLSIRGDLDDYLALEMTDEQRGSLYASLAAQVSCRNVGKKITRRLYIHEAILPVNLAGGVWARPGNADQYSYVGFFLNRASRYRYPGMHSFSLDDVPGIKDAKKISVRIVPDFALALYLRHDTCFNGIVEWPALKISRPRPGVDTPAIARAKTPSYVGPDSEEIAELESSAPY